MTIIHDIIIHSYVKSKRKTLCISVSVQGEVRLKVPLHVGDDEVHAFVLRKKEWIQKKLAYFAQFEDIAKIPLTKRQSIFYLGKEYQLSLQNDQGNTMTLHGNTLILLTSKRDDVRHNERVLNRWLLTQAERIFHERLSHVLQNFPKLTRPVLKVRKYKSRWGSYASNHIMSLNSALIHADISITDYIITHELCHYYHKGHGADFYALLTQKMPQWKELKKNLNASSMLF